MTLRVYLDPDSNEGGQGLHTPVHFPTGEIELINLDVTKPAWYD